MICDRSRRRTTLRIATIVAIPALASLPGSSASAACRIVDATEVLRDHVDGTGSSLTFVDLDGRKWSLVTSTADPVITNKGSGTFHPVAPEAAQAALDDISYPGLDRLDARIFCLPYPRRDLLSSSAGDGAIYLSPGVYPWPDGPLHALISHEIGHIVHRTLLPDANTAGWQRYRELRGITNEAVYNESAAHRNRPHEIFAEDFRALFGGIEANYSGTIENTDLAPPADVPGLRDFMLSLLGAQTAAAAPTPVRIELAAWPNPFRSATNLSVHLDGDEPQSLMILDASGRLVRDLGGTDLRLDGKIGWRGVDRNGREVPSGVYFLRVTTAGGSVQSLRLVLSR